MKCIKCGGKTPGPGFFHCSASCEHSAKGMDKDVVINKLRVLVNHLPLMSSDFQSVAIANANIMLDRYFAGNGKFIKTDIDDWVPTKEVFVGESNL